MADILSKRQRSERMKSVKQEGTSLELLVRRELHKRGLRYRVHDRTLPGRPDMVFPARRAVLFVHGCFWHAHECRLGRRPTSNIDFWEQKALANRSRDARKEAELRMLGWRVFVVWQCELAPSSRDAVLNRLEKMLRKVGPTR
jgi:DNA mismatch endonuclease, patch repair protein